MSFTGTCQCLSSRFHDFRFSLRISVRSFGFPGTRVAEEQQPALSRVVNSKSVRDSTGLVHLKRRRLLDSGQAALGLL